MRLLIDSAFGVSARRLAANLHCRLGVESWLAPAAAVISHPKSGRTWLRVMLAEAGINRVCFSHAGSGEQAALTIAELGSILDLWRGKRIILLARDPRDIAVSFYFQATRRSHVFSGTFGDFLRDPRFGIERVIRFNLLWLSQRTQFLAFNVLTYEQLHSDPQTSLSRIAEVLKDEILPESELKKAVARSAFDVLHELELSGEGKKRWGFRLAPGDRADPESFKTRRGIVGGWADYFDPADAAYAQGILDTYDYFALLRAAQKANYPVELSDAVGRASRPPPAQQSPLFT